MPHTINLLINGEAFSCPSGCYLPEILANLGLPPHLSAVQYNGRILPYRFLESIALQEGDRLDILSIAGSVL